MNEPAGGPLQALQDTAIAALRTAFPALWSALIVWGVSHWAALDHVKDWLYGPAQALVFAALVAGIRYLFGFIEKKKWIPDWVAVLLLGSAKRPVYLEPHIADAVNDGQSVPVVAKKENS